MANITNLDSMLDIIEKLDYKVLLGDRVISVKDRISRGGFGGIYRSGKDVIKVVNGFTIPLNEMAGRIGVEEDNIYGAEIGYNKENGHRSINLFMDGVKPQLHHLNRADSNTLGAIIAEVEIGRHLQGLDYVLSAKEQRFLVYGTPLGFELFLGSAFLFDYFDGDNLMDVIGEPTKLSQGVAGDWMEMERLAHEEYIRIEEEHFGIHLKDDNAVPYNEEQRFEAAIKLGETLKLLWGKGIVHRDIKPNNVMVSGDPLSKDYQLKLHDYGSACVIDEGGFPIIDEGKWENLNQDYKKQTNLRATREFVAPEHAKDISARITGDIYSYALSVFHILTGTPFFVYSNARGFSVARARGVDEFREINKRSMYDCFDIMGYDKLSAPMSNALGKEEERNMDALLYSLREQKNNL